MPLIIVNNFSTLVNDNAVAKVVEHLQVQVKRDFGPAWGIDADVWFWPTSKGLPSGSWQIGIFDTSDQAGALGYHDLSSQGTPLGKVFVKTTVDAGDSWSVTFSHELLEMLADPYINLVAFNQSTNTRGELIAYEVGDPVEDDKLGYSIGSVLVSDFVLPTYFVPGTSGPYDFKGHVTKPLQVLSGGYLSVFNVTNGSGWTSVNGRYPKNTNRLEIRAKHHLHRQSSTR